MLEIESLLATYGPVRALDRFSLEVPERSITAVLGANGAGKTSLLRAISGLLRARSGRIRFEGRAIERLATEEIVRLGIAHVPEERGVIAELTVEENLRLGGLWRGRRANLAARLDEAYELFPLLAERRTKLASTLSGGERQMLSIGRALVGQPRLLLLDEPSLGLAPQIAAQIMRLLSDLRERIGLTVLLVEQNAKAALSIADRAVVLNLGRTAADEEASVLARDDQLRRAYLGF